MSTSVWSQDHPSTFTGASAVQVGTATFWDPRSPLRIAGELAAFLQREKIARAADLVGTLKM